MRAIGQEVIKLDVKVDEQWTEEGLPSVDYIAAAVKNPAVTRDMIEAAVPAFNRRVAEDVAAGF